MKRTMKDRERKTLYYLQLYADAIRCNESIGTAACNAHFAVKMFVRYTEKERGVKAQ